MRFLTSWISILLAASLILSACSAGAQRAAEMSSAQPSGSLSVVNDSVPSGAADEGLRSLGYTAGSPEKPAEDSAESEDDESGSDGEQYSQLAPATGEAEEDGDYAGEELIPEGWPYYIPIMEGLTVRYGASDENGLRVGAKGEISLLDVREFYQSLPEWNVGTERTGDNVGSESDLGEWHTCSFVITRGDESLRVNIVELNGKTTLDLLYNKM